MPRSEFPPSEALYPVPVVLVSCGSAENANVITVAWCGVVCSKPPLLSISIRPSRHSNKLIREVNDFVVNMPTEELIKNVDLCGTTSGADRDKFSLCNFTKIPSKKITSVMIEECPVNIECKLNSVTKLGTHDMFIGEVVTVHVDKSILSSDGGVDYKKAKPIVYNQGEYWGMGEKIGSYGFSGKSR